MHKKRILVIVICSVLVLAIAAGAVWFFFFRTPEVPADPNEIAYVTPVSELSSAGGIGIQDRFTGVVEPQQTLEVQKDDSKKVAELYVTEGQMVNVGDKLFSYDTEDLALQLEEAELELESLDNRITTLNQQVETLTNEQKKAPADERLSYTLQIQSTQLEIRSTEYDRSIKAKDLEQLRSGMLNTDVTAEMAGIVKSIRSEEDENMGMGDSSGAYITILSTGQYRIKATATELNLQNLYEGMPVQVLSRVDENQTWPGTIEIVEREPAQNDSSGGMIYYGSEDSFTQATKYNFYVVLDSSDGLMLGQHVYVEPNSGSPVKTGIWLPSYFVVTEGATSYVWAADSRGTLEKRDVSLGQYDETADEFEILSGLELDDRIAVPTESLHSGMFAADGTEPNLPQGGGPGMIEGNAGMEGIGDGEDTGDADFPDGTDGMDGMMVVPDAVPEGEGDGEIDGIDVEILPEAE